MGIVNMGMSIGFALGPIIGGEVGDLGQLLRLFYFGAGHDVPGILIFLYFSRPSSFKSGVTIVKTTLSHIAPALAGA